jgi:aminopeptidase N
MGGGVRRIRTPMLAIVALAVVAVAASPAGAGVATTGSNGIGDPYYPLYGNGGYDVRHYDLDVTYDPDTDHLTGIARLTLVPKADLSRFNLDFVGLRVHAMTVAAAPATWTRTLHHELVVTPGHTLRPGHAVQMVVRYGGIPETFRIPGTPIETGVVPTDDGAEIWGEPDVAAAWFPVNDHPRDKATYEIALTVPQGVEAISNGTLRGRSTHDGWTTWHWVERHPMASYLALAAIGQFELRFRRTATGKPVIDAVDPDLGRRADRAVGAEIRILRFLARQFGPYPFDALGAVVDDTTNFVALENQTRPLYASNFFQRGGGSFVVAHELAHQWFGDSVSVDTWQETWLNEGFATYAEWLWAQATGKGTPAGIAASWCGISAGEDFWDLEIGDPGVNHLFDGPVYIRGALTLQAIRRRVGATDFFRILRQWAALRANATGTTEQFRALAEGISGESLAPLFDEWLFNPSKPSPCAPDTGGDARDAHPVPTARGMLRLGAIEDRGTR